MFPRLAQWLLTLAPLVSAKSLTDDWHVIAVYNDSQQGTTIECLSNHRCQVLCHGVAACQNATIDCPSDWACLVSCGEASSCLGATIIGPWNYGADLDVECGVFSDACREVTVIGGQSSAITIGCYGEDSCRNAIIHAPRSEILLIKGCDVTGGCIGMNITCPPNDDGVPKCTFIFDNEFGGTSDEPLTIYAENGFSDLNMTESNSSLRYGTVYCADDYSQSCNINEVTADHGRDKWICDTNGSSYCNAPPHVSFWVQASWQNMNCTSTYFVGIFSSPLFCVDVVVEEMQSICGEDGHIMWSDTFEDECYCCLHGSTYQFHLEWDVYSYGITTVWPPTLTPHESDMTTTPPPVPTASRIVLSPTNFPTRGPTTSHVNDVSSTDSTRTVEPTMNPTFEPTMNPTFEPTMNPSSEPTMNPTFAPMMNPSFKATEWITETTFNSESNSEEFNDSVVRWDRHYNFSRDDLHPPTPTVSGNTQDVFQTSFQWSIHYTIYALLGMCSVCSLAFAIGLNVHSKRKLDHIATEDDSTEQEGVANFDDHPSLNPESSKFVPGKVHPAAEVHDNHSNNRMQSLEVKVSVMEYTPSSIDSIIPERDPELEGHPTGDDV